MLITIEDDFNPDTIAGSGQCFRWHKTDNQSYNIVSQGRCLQIRRTSQNHIFECSCSESEFQIFWHDYFDLKTCYKRIRESIPASDSFLYTAARHEAGIRILRQDPWEMIVTFIISQRKSIPAIKTAVENLCRKSGRPLQFPDGTMTFSFPTPEELSRLSMDDLNKCGLGYRSGYLYKVTRAVLAKQFDIAGARLLDDESLFRALLMLTGIGEKVASCVMLFGYHRLNAFPRDVWIKRILADKYPLGFPLDFYKPYNGVMQQYMFDYYRRRMQ